MNKKRKSFNRSNNEMSLKKIMLRSLWFSLFFFVFGLIISIILSWIFYNMSDPTSKIELIGLISIYFSAVITSFIQAKINGQHYFLTGLLLGTIIFCLTVIFSLIFPIEKSFSLSSFIWRGLVIIVCILGSALGIKKDKHKKRHLKKY